MGNGIYACEYAHAIAVSTSAEYIIPPEGVHYFRLHPPPPPLVSPDGLINEVSKILGKAHGQIRACVGLGFKGSRAYFVWCKGLGLRVSKDELT